MKVWEGKRVIGGGGLWLSRKGGKKEGEGLKSDDGVGENYLC